MTTTLTPASIIGTPDRDQWIAERPTFLGSSDSPAVLGCGYSGENQHTVWLRKMGLADEMPDDDKLLCGRLLQDGICAVIAHKTGYDIQPANEFETYRSQEHPWLGATPDSFIHGDPRGLGVCELKNVDHHLLRDWKGEEPPLRVAVQLQHQLIAVGATWGICAAIIGGNRPVWFELTLHSRLIDAMIPALRKFWTHVETKTPPPVDASEGCSRALAAMFPADTGLSKPLPADACRWFDELTALKRAEKWIGQRKDLVQNRIKAQIGDATTGQLPDGRSFSWKQQTSNYPACEAYSSTFRVLRQHGPRVEPERAVNRLSECTSRLLALGAVLYAESDSGSRYFELAGGLRVRLADHAPNEATAAWMDRGEVTGVRIDQDDWQSQLEAITGESPINESEGV